MIAIVVVVDRRVLMAGLTTFEVGVRHGRQLSKRCDCVGDRDPVVRSPRGGLAGFVRRPTTSATAVSLERGVAPWARTPAVQLLRRPRDGAEPRGGREGTQVFYRLENEHVARLV